MSKLQPLKQFMVTTWIPIRIGSLDLSLTNSAAFMLLAVALILVGMFLGLRRPQIIPTPWQAIAEYPLAAIETMVKETNGPEGRPFVGLLASVFLFIFTGNLLGLFPFAFTFTSQLIVNFTLAFALLAVMTVYGLVQHGWAFLRLFMPKGIPWWIAPILVPVELISYLSRPISLSIRLFSNMVAGHSMLKIFAFFTGSMGIFGGLLPLGVNVGLMGFELFVAFLQAYVFTLLTCIYINDALHVH